MDDEEQGGRRDEPSGDAAAAGRLALRLRRAAVVSLLVLASFGFVFVLAEVGLRAIGQVRDIDFRVYRKQLATNHGLIPEIYLRDPHSVANPLMRPNFTTLATTADFSVVYRINSHGFRDDEIPIERVPGKARVIALGDSFTFGNGLVDGKRFLDLAEREAGHLELVNFGTPGHGLDHAFLLLIEKGLRYSPDGVILFLNMMDTIRYQDGFYVDGRVQLSARARALLDGLDPHRKEMAAPASVPASSGKTIYLSEEEREALKRRSWLVRNSHLASLVSYQWELFRLRERLAVQDKKEWFFIERELAHDLQSAQGAWLERRTSTIVRTLFELCRERGIDFAVVNIDHQYPLSFLGDIDPDMAYLNLHPILSRAHEERSLTFTYDHHYNEYANRIIADELRPFLADKMQLYSAHMRAD